MMCCYYIDEVEKETKRNVRVDEDEVCLGFCASW